MLNAGRNKTERYYCGHCKERVSKTLYFNHKRLYYDPSLQQWKNDAQEAKRDEDQEFTFSDSEDSEVGTLTKGYVVF